MIGRNLWLALGVVIGLIAWALTLWITHVNHNAGPIVSIAFDERPSFQFDRIPMSFSALQRDQRHFPEVALTGKEKILFFVTPATRSIAISGANANDFSCGSFDDAGESEAALLAGAGRSYALTPIPVQANGEQAIVAIPGRLRVALARTPGTRGAIACTLRRQLASAPTFTERAITVHETTGPGGAVLLDVSALDDIDDLRFSGGLQAPLGGDRTRLLFGGNNVVSAEWVDVTAAERRDIVLVLVGALSAIAAATIIEGIRPLVERRSKR